MNKKNQQTTFRTNHTINFINQKIDNSIVHSEKAIKEILTTLAKCPSGALSIKNKEN